MKKIIILLFFIALSGISRAQQPIDTLYLWVNFQEENIVIDIPKDYFTLRTVVPQLPRFVALRKLNIMVPPLPTKEALLQSFRKYLTQSASPADNYQRLDWLRVMALYLYFDQGTDQKFLSEMGQVLENWKQMSNHHPIKSELLLVERWMLIKLE
ncbi:MAG: hypothetical protein CVT94_17210 [Bacteroidetes bacterium HGW-Bacteroidetes-11]|jgi:hypothetical protein|nr:MAG: hypothetical protein CVT94_17210 [Bacteroidetes bacterium HGW-Bacteroidetes-11]